MAQWINRNLHHPETCSQYPHKARGLGINKKEQTGSKTTGQDHSAVAHSLPRHATTSVKEARRKRNSAIPLSAGKREKVDDVDRAFLSNPESDPARKAFHHRNLQRIREATIADKRVISKYLPTDLHAFFPFWILGPDDYQNVRRSWLDRIKSVALSNCPVPKRPAFSFRTDPESLQQNQALLRRVDFNSDKALAEQQGTTAWHGAEFRLEKVIGDHPRFGYLKQVFTRGMEYLFRTTLTEGERVVELSAQLARGNHKSAMEDEPYLAQLLEKDVTHGFCLPLPKEATRYLKGAMVQPCGLATQFGLNPDGSWKLKKRLTHDLTYSITHPEASVNALSGYRPVPRDGLRMVPPTYHPLHRMAPSLSS